MQKLIIYVQESLSFQNNVLTLEIRIKKRRHVICIRLTTEKWEMLDEFYTLHYYLLFQNTRCVVNKMSLVRNRFDKNHPLLSF